MYWSHCTTTSYKHWIKHGMTIKHQWWWFVTSWCTWIVFMSNKMKSTTFTISDLLFLEIRWVFLCYLVSYCLLMNRAAAFKVVYSWTSMCLVYWYCGVCTHYSIINPFPKISFSAIIWFWCLLLYVRRLLLACVWCYLEMNLCGFCLNIRINSVNDTIKATINSFRNWSDNRINMVCILFLQMPLGGWIFVLFSVQIFME